MNINKVFKSLAVLNLTDGLFTLLFTICAGATELNPIMKAALDTSPWLFLLVKILLSLFLWRAADKQVSNKSSRFHDTVMLVVLIIYACINLMHLVSLSFFAYSLQQLV